MKIHFQVKFSKLSSGFTLIELLISMTVLSIIVSGLVASRVMQQSQGISQQQTVEIQQNVRAALSIILDDIRMAGYDPDGDNGAGIDTATSSQLKFSYVADDDDEDNDGDGVDDNDGELRTMTLMLKDLDNDGNAFEFIMNDGVEDKLIAENVSQLFFEYLSSYDIDDDTVTTTSVISEIRAVKVTLTTIVDSDELDYTKGNNTRTLSVSIKCRNLGL